MGPQVSLCCGEGTERISYCVKGVACVLRRCSTVQLLLYNNSCVYILVVVFISKADGVYFPLIM